MMSYREINLSQGSQDWLAWRKTHVTSSDAPMILGVSPYATALQLWERKLGRRPEPAPHPGMARGHALEPAARALFEAKRFVQAPPCVIESTIPEHDWMGASLDGLFLDFGVPVPVEYKAPNIKDHEMACDGVVPEKYRVQVQHQLATLGPKAMAGWYVSYRPGHTQEYVEVEVPRDELFIQGSLLPLERAFIGHLRAQTPPVPDAFAMAAYHWRSIQEALEELQAMEAEAREELLRHVPEDQPRFQGNGVMVTRSIRAGSVDWERLVRERFGVTDEAELDALKSAYRKEGTRSTKVTASGESFAPEIEPSLTAPVDVLETNVGWLSWLAQ